jgi:hypothetical protein
MNFAALLSFSMCGELDSACLDRFSASIREPLPGLGLRAQRQVELGRGTSVKSPSCSLIPGRR